MGGIYQDRKEVINNTNIHQKKDWLRLQYIISDEIAPGTLNSIFKQAQIKKK
jgi:hypothetical protein